MQTLFYGSVSMTFKTIKVLSFSLKVDRYEIQSIGVNLKSQLVVGDINFAVIYLKPLC